LGGQAAKRSSQYVVIGTYCHMGPPGFQHRSKVDGKKVGDKVGGEVGGKAGF
jgi:hypothetical protein